MRVIAGISRGINIETLEGMNTRPTIGRIKESLFNIINPYLYNSDFLDLFSGSGSIGIEALSRGANSCTFIEYNNKCIDIINKNLNKTKLSTKAELYNLDIYDAISKLASKGKKFDIIFMDPPYKEGYYENVLDSIYNNSILKDDGLIILEHASDININTKNYNKSREKKYKKISMTFLENGEGIC